MVSVLSSPSRELLLQAVAPARPLGPGGLGWVIVQSRRVSSLIATPVPGHGFPCRSGSSAVRVPSRQMTLSWVATGAAAAYRS